MPTSRTFWGPVIGATAALARGDHAAAVEAMRPAEATERARPGAVVLRGRALFGAGRIEEAAAAFQLAIDNRFVAEPSPLATVARIWLARARAKLGDAAAARRHYQDAFAAWKNADPDVPILVEARKEVRGAAAGAGGPQITRGCPAPRASVEGHA